MIRGLSRFVGYVCLAGAFIAFVVDGARYVANDAWAPLTTAAAIQAVVPRAFSGSQASGETRLPGFLWDVVAAPALDLPFFVAAVVLAVVLLLLGRKPKKLIGYSSHE